VLSGKQTQKAAATPPTLKPAAPAPSPAPAPSGPLSLPQTTAQLPPQQPINPEALVIAKPAEETVETQPAQRPPRRAAGPAQGPPRAASDTIPLQQPQTPAAPAAATPPPETERPALQEILPANELARLKESADSRKREIRKILDQQDNRKVNEGQRALIAQIRGFVQQSDEAEAKGDMRVAESLAERASILVRELPGGR
jgi:hypothetical protein